MTSINIAIFITLIGLTLFSLIKFHKHINTIRNCLLCVVIIGNIILYFIAFMDSALPYEEFVYIFLKAIQATFLSIILETNLDAIVDMMPNITFYWAFTIINYCAIIVVIMIITTIIARKSFAWIRFVCRITNESFIFPQTNESSILFAKDILKNNNRTLVIFFGEGISTDETEIFKNIDSFGGIYLSNKIGSKDFLETRLFKIHAKYSKVHIFFLEENEDKNISETLKMIHIFSHKKNKKIQKNICAYVHIQSENLQEIFEEQCRKQDTSIEYSVFNTADLVALDFIKKYPAVKTISIDTEQGIATENYEVMLIGFDKKGQALLKKIIEFSQFVGSTFKATIIDKKITEKQGSFSTLYPALEKEYNLTFLECPIGKTDFFEKLQNERKTLKQIIIALGNDELNIQTAIEVYTFLKNQCNQEIPIYAVITSTESYPYIDESESFKTINCIGQKETIFTEAHIINKKTSEHARKINEYYRVKKQNKPTWEELEYIKKISNISVATHIQTKLELIGLNFDQAINMTQDEFIDFIKMNNRLENLAKTEKLRWNACYYTHGWTNWDLQDIPNENKNGQNFYQKKHACLVDWDKLVNIDTFFELKEGTYQNYDRDNILNLYKTIKTLEKKR